MARTTPHLTGQTFGRLTVGEYQHQTPTIPGGWVCRCSCGAKVIVPTTRLTSRAVRSCGCLRIEKMQRRTIAGRRRGTPLETVTPDDWNDL
ncbi:MAG TPA: hypothetical protein VMV33_17475 [Rhodocyclaceae bacterium]|nr:hypothetical protein [Rhodocyclaceae bacterium]